MDNRIDIGRLSRRRFLGAALLGSGGCAVAAAQETWQSKMPAPKPVEGPFRLLCAPVLTNPAPDGVTVIWATNDTATGWVEYGETEQLGRLARGSHQGLLPFVQRIMKIRVTGLKPGTRYFYRVRAEQTIYDWHRGILRNAKTAAASELLSFTTPDPSASEARFTVWNDTHEQAETLQKVHAAHEQSRGDFLLWNGDLTNDLYDDEKLVEQFLNPAGLPFAARVPYYFVRGNHDARGPFAREIDSVTDVPHGLHYYTFRHGPLAGIVLDTGEDKLDEDPAYSGLSDFAAFRSLQAEWLSKAIEAPEVRGAPFRVLFCHIPLWWRNDKATGTYCLDGQRKWHDLLVKGRIQVVVSGHTHDPECFFANERHPYVQIIGGGPRPAGATYLRGRATQDRLSMTQYKLDGTVKHEVELRA